MTQFALNTRLALIAFTLMSGAAIAAASPVVVNPLPHMAGGSPVVVNPLPHMAGGSPVVVNPLPHLAA